MNLSRLDSLGMDRMVSGHLCLNLSQNVNWDEFPDFANELLDLLKGTVLSRCDGVDVRLWNVVVDGMKLKLVFDDFPIMTTFESSDGDGDALLQQIYSKLKKYHSRREG